MGANVITSIKTFVGEINQAVREAKNGIKDLTTAANIFESAWDGAITSETFKSELTGSIKQSRIEEFRTATFLQPYMKVGDIIEFDRILYNHCGLFIGGPSDDVLHVKVKYNVKGDLESSVMVVEPLSDVAKGNLVRISTARFEKLAKKLFNMRMLPKSAIKQRINDFKNKCVKYSLRRENCEFISTYIVFGRGFSSQVLYPFRATRPGRFIMQLARSTCDCKATLSLMEARYGLKVLCEYRKLCYPRPVVPPCPYSDSENKSIYH